MKEENKAPLIDFTDTNFISPSGEELHLKSVTYNEHNNTYTIEVW